MSSSLLRDEVEHKLLELVEQAVIGCKRNVTNDIEGVVTIDLRGFKLGLVLEDVWAHDLESKNKFLYYETPVDYNQIINDLLEETDYMMDCFDKWSGFR